MWPIKRALYSALSRMRRVASRTRTLCVALTTPGLKIEFDCVIGWRTGLALTDGGQLSVRRGSSIGVDCQITAKRGFIEIGSDVFIGPSCIICANQGIRIGNDVLIAERVSIRDQDHNIHVDGLIRESGMVVAPIAIGDDVWIAAGAVILKGVTIGRGAVVGANAVVNRDVAEYEIVGGVPAKHLGFRKGFQPNA